VYNDRCHSCLVTRLAATVVRGHTKPCAHTVQVGVAAKRSDGDNGAAALGQLRSDVPAVLRAAAKQLREKPIKTRMGAFGVLRDLVLVMPEAVTTDPGLLVPGIINALNVRPLIEQQLGDGQCCSSSSTLSTCAAPLSINWVMVTDVRLCYTNLNAKCGANRHHVKIEQRLSSAVSP